MKYQETPLVSIIIPVYNGANFISEAIESALNQTYSNIEVIIVDDGSTDNTEKIIQKFRGRVKYYKKKNGGVASALNLAIKKSKGDYISWLSHDDLYLPEKISMQIDRVLALTEKEKEDTVIFSDMRIFNYDQNKYYDNEKIQFSNEAHLYEYSMLKIFFESKINACTMLFPKSVFIKYGTFDEKLLTIQDYMFLINIFVRGVRFNFLDVPLITTRHHANQDTKRKLIKHIKELNILYTKAYDLNREAFNQMPLWQFDKFLRIIKMRGLEYAYMNMLSGWASILPESSPTIWMYWENHNDRKTPDYIRLCWKTIINNNRSSFNIKILNEHTVEEYLPGITAKIGVLNEIAHKADYIRFQLLAKFGGIWLDSDFIALRNFEPILPLIKKNGFVCNAYLHKSGKFFPIINFLGAEVGNTICLNVIDRMDELIAKAKGNNQEIKWDDLGGWNLADFINDKKFHCYIFDSKVFMPFNVHADGNLKLLSPNKEGSNYLHSLTYGQAIANSVLDSNFKLLSEDQWLVENNIISYLFTLGLGNIDRALTDTGDYSFINREKKNFTPIVRRSPKDLLKKGLRKILLLFPLYRKLESLDILINERHKHSDEILNAILVKEHENGYRIDSIVNNLKERNIEN